MSPSQTLWELTPRDGVNGGEVLLFKTAPVQYPQQRLSWERITKFAEDDASLQRWSFARIRAASKIKLVSQEMKFLRNTATVFEYLQPSLERDR